MMSTEPNTAATGMGELPDLPPSDVSLGKRGLAYTADQMHAYARQALAAQPAPGVGGDAVRVMAKVLKDAWDKAEPSHLTTMYPESYLATFTDMAKAALSTRPAESVAQGGEWPARFGCNGPEGSFWTDDSSLANKLIAATYDRDEWTVTDTTNPTGISSKLVTTPTPATGSGGEAVLYDAASKGFHISESCGTDGKYLHIIKFRSLDDLHAYEDAWTKTMVAVRDSR